MSLQTQISNELWDVIASQYEDGNFSHAILEAIHLLTSVLREKSGTDGDGVPLVGQALGGDAPKLRINAFQSETDKNIQRGIEHILRGVYLAIRNPRSHNQFKDSQQDADSIIHFLDFILRLLNASREAFTIEKFVLSASDPDFVESKRYAEILAAEIPAGRRGDAITALFKARDTVEMNKLRYLVPSLLSLLSEVQLAEYLGAVSDELRTVTEDKSIRTSLQMLTPDLWSRIAEPARLRVENKLIRDVSEGEILQNGKTTRGLGTWSRRFMKRFALRPEAAQVLLNKLEDTDQDDRRYVARYFFSVLPEILSDEGEMRRGIRAIGSAIRDGDINIREAVVDNILQFPTPWQNSLAEELKDLSSTSNPAVILADGTPILEAQQTAEITDDDIPF